MKRRPVSKRRQARETALQALYTGDQRGFDLTGTLEILEHLSQDLLPDVKDFARTLVEGVLLRQALLDERLSSKLQNWRIERLAPVDRSILRQSTYELLFIHDVPPRVTLNEAIELAKTFGDDKSGQFVNGVLDALLTEQAPDA